MPGYKDLESPGDLLHAYITSARIPRLKVSHQNVAL